MGKIKDQITDNDGFAKIPAKECKDVMAPAAATSNLPATMGDNRGFEEPVDQTDLIIPRAKVLQPTADELTQEGCTLRAGQIINSLTKEPLPSVFTPIMYWKEYLRFNARKKDDVGFSAEFAPGALMWRTRDANDPRVKAECQFGPNGEVPLALTTLNFLCVFDGEAMPAILSFAKTSYKTGKNLLSLAKLRGGAMFSRRYKLGVTSVKNDEGNYFVLKVDPAGDCNAEQFTAAEGYFNSFASRRDEIKTHAEAE